MCLRAGVHVYVRVLGSAIHDSPRSLSGAESSLEGKCNYCLLQGTHREHLHVTTPELILPSEPVCCCSFGSQWEPSTTFSPRGKDQEMHLSPYKLRLYSRATETRWWHFSHTESSSRSLSLAVEVSRQSQLNLMSSLGGSGQPAALTRDGRSGKFWRQDLKPAHDATHRLGVRLEGCAWE